MAERWGLIVERTSGVYHPRYQPEVLAEVVGTREEALAELARHVTEYERSVAHTRDRKRLFRTDDGFLSIREGGMSSWGCRFSVAQLILDTNDAKEAAAAAKQAEKARRAAERKARREERRAVIEDDFEDDTEDRD